MSHVLSREKREQVIALGRLGWSLRRIEQATGVRRETASEYLRGAGIALRRPGGWGRHSPSKPAIDPITDSGSENSKPAINLNTDSGGVEAKPAIEVITDFSSQKSGCGPASSCEPYRELIAVELERGRNAMGIWQDLVDSHGFAPLLIIDDLGMRKLPLTAAEELLEIIMRRYERASTMLTSNRPVEDWGKLLGDAAAGSAMLDRLLHHGHVLKCGPRSWRTKTGGAGEN